MEARLPDLVSLATYLAQATVALSKGASSKAPSGPFQTMVLAASKAVLMRDTVSVPASRIMSSSATSVMLILRLGELALNSLATTTSVGRSRAQPLEFAVAMISLAVGSRSCSQRDL